MEPYYKDHWVNIEPERLERYEQMFQWGPAHEWMFEPARIEPGQTVADFGCGPGGVAVELARRVGSRGHVHALDINVEFIEATRKKAEAEGLSDRITAHLLTGTPLPLADDVLDCLIAKNVMVYVDDPAETFREFHRVVKPGGRVHAIDSDWATAFVEPVPLEQWRVFLDAAMHAFHNPLMGRQMYGLARKAGFTSMEVRVSTNPDTSGRLGNMVKNLAGYARVSKKISEEDIQAVLKIVDDAITESTFFASNPQYLLTAVV